MDELITVEAFVRYGDYPDDYTKGGKTTYDGNATRTTSRVCSTIREQAKLKRKSLGGSVSGQGRRKAKSWSPATQEWKVLYIILLYFIAIYNIIVI